MIYEERLTTLKEGGFEEYLDVYRNLEHPSVEDSGGHVLIRLNGLIGDDANHVTQIIEYPSFESWTTYQNNRLNQIGSMSALVEKEEVRLLRAISTRPKSAVPKVDYRSVYGLRRFLIESSDIDEFVHCSEKGIWPRIEAQGACILGLWTTYSSTTPTEIILATGYHSPSHWEETRHGDGPIQNIDKSLLLQEGPLRKRRAELWTKSWVRLMKNLDL